MTETAHDTAPLVANKQAIAKHLYQLFSPAFVMAYPDSWIEIAYGRPEGNLDKASNFPAFDLAEAIDFAIEQNAAGHNVYVGAALRHGKPGSTGRANKGNVLDASHAWAEYDGAGDDERIKALLKANNLTPAVVVTTGTVPHVRRHLYFKLDGSVTREHLVAINTALCELLDTDAVQDAPRVMRLAGCVSYPSPKKQLERGYVAELVTLQTNPTAPAYNIEALIGLSATSTPDEAWKNFIDLNKDHKPGRTEAEIIALLNSINGKDGGKEHWRNPMIRVVASMIGLAWSNFQIKMVCGPHCKGGFDDKDLQKIIDDQRADFEKPDVVLQDTAETDEAVKPGELPVIEIKDGQLSALATRAEKMLIAAGVPIYQRGGMLVRPIIETVDASRGRRTKVAQLRVLDAVYLRDLMGTYAQWIKYDSRKKRNVLTNPPFETAATLLARAGDWTFPRIMGIISAPTMRPDGSLLLAAGYDESTGLLLVEPPPMPVVLEQPSREDALKALALIEGLIVGFPFVNDVDKAVALSAIITPVVRGAFPVTPMHASRAPTAGSGKSFLWDIFAAIAIGQLMPVMSTGPDVNELEKRLGAAMMTGQPLISIDNISGDLGGDTLCQIIERPVVEIRILGRSEQVRIEARGTSTYSTGNNFVVVGDLCRRVITCNLDAAMERPELRQFDFDPIARILADRGAYIAACLTICRAYLVAGRPGLAPKLASFEGHSDVVRSALIWLGREDVVKSMEAARAEDPEQAELSEMLEAWARVIGVGDQSRVKLADVILRGMAVVRPNMVDLDNPSIMEPKHPDLYAALEAVALRTTGKRGQKPDGKMLGDWMRRFRGRVVDGKRFAYLPNEKRGAEWWVEIVGST